jgi:hypothetical protein
MNRLYARSAVIFSLVGLVLGALVLLPAHAHGLPATKRISDR